MDIESISQFLRERDGYFVLDEPLGYRLGKARGEAKACRDVAIEMKKENMPIETIIKFTQLSVEEIEKL